MSCQNFVYVGSLRNLCAVGRLVMPAAAAAPAKFTCCRKKSYWSSFELCAHIRLLRLKLLHIVEPVGLAKRSIVEEIVAHPDIRHGRLRD